MSLPASPEHSFFAPNPLAAATIARLASDEALVALLLRALDSELASDAEFSALAEFARPRAQRLMKAAHAAIGESGRAFAKKALSALDAPGERGAAAQTRFAQTLGDPKWVEWAAGMSLSDDASLPAPRENPEAFEKKTTRGCAFAAFLVKSTTGRFDPAAWNEWAKACVLNALWQDLSSRNNELSNSRRQLAELRERGFLRGFDWAPAAERMLTAARRAVPGKHTRHANAFMGPSSSVSLPSACDAGADGVRLARLAIARDFAPSAIARAIGKNTQSRLEALDASGVVSESAWAEALSSPALPPQARAWLEARALRAEMAKNQSTNSASGIAGAENSLPPAQSPSRALRL